jgi:hypothetical protein
VPAGDATMTRLFESQAGGGTAVLVE